MIVHIQILEFNNKPDISPTSLLITDIQAIVCTHIGAEA